MERISNLIPANGQMQTLSENRPTSSPKSSVSSDEYVALWKLINRARMLNGWTTKTAAELDDTIETWGEQFKKYGIPVDAYPELYDRAFDFQQNKLRLGVEPPQMDARLLVACWTGENGLKKERETKRQIASDRQLYMPKTAPDCGKCLDTGRQLFGGEACDCGREA